jgi:hypothetical protein
MSSNLPTIDSTKKELPRDPSPEMVAAMEAHFQKWQDIIGYSDRARKAQCWDALQAYRKMWEAA